MARPRSSRRRTPRHARPAITGRCLCGAVAIEVARLPRTLTQCNCSVCRRYGTLWAYYQRGQVTITAARGALASYAVKRGGLKFERCTTCGCVIRWMDAGARFGLNARLLDHARIAHLTIRVLDGDQSWKTLDRYAKPAIFISPARAVP